MIAKFGSISFFISLAVLFSACKKENTSQSIQLHTDYFPLQEGRYIIYTAQEIVHDDDAGVHDTVKFQLKTVWGEIYEDNLGRVGREFLRYKSYDQGQTWQLTDVWSGFVSSSSAEMVEENQRKIKLVFAPTEDKVWNINSLNNLNAQEAFYENIHQPYSWNNHQFDSTVTVIQADFFSLVDYQKQKEMYAKNVGLIEKSYKDLVIENFDTLHPKKGNEIWYRLIDFGIE